MFYDFQSMSFVSPIYFFNLTQLLLYEIVGTVKPLI